MTSSNTSGESTESLPTNPDDVVAVEEVVEPEDEGLWYLALRALHIPNAPGSVPSSIKVAKGVRFQLDGDEPILVDRLLRQGAFKVYEPGTADDELIESEKIRRGEEAAKPRLSTRRRRRSES